MALIVVMNWKCHVASMSKNLEVGCCGKTVCILAGHAAIVPKRGNATV